MIDPNRIAAAIATACVGLTLAGTASAVDLRSWDQKINDATKRFVVLPAFGSQAVLDKETQLVWQKVPESINANSTWVWAHLSCQNTTTGGRRGWRLPTGPEFASVFGPDGVKPSVFNDVPNGYYWTATPYPVGSAYALTVKVPTGASSGYPPTSELHPYWCVRGPA